MADSFKTEVLDAVSRALGRKVQAPQRDGLAWDYAEGEDFREVQLTVPAEALAGPFRADGPSSPTLALCLAAALDALPGPPARAAVTVVGDMPELPRWEARPSRELLQYRRSAFLLSLLAELLPERFHLSIDPQSAWAWPALTWFSIEGYRKNKGRPPGGKARLAFEIELSPQMHSNFCEAVEPIRRFQSLLPVIVHADEVTRDTPYTQAGKTGVELWVASADDRRLHLFELGVGSKGSVGALAEALCKVGMLAHVSDKNGHFDREAVGLAAVRKARRAAMWLCSDAYHPLVFDEDAGESTVLSWLNRALRRQSFQLGILPWEGEVAAPHFRFQDRWGGGIR